MNAGARRKIFRGERRNTTLTNTGLPIDPSREIHVIQEEKRQDENEKTKPIQN